VLVDMRIAVSARLAYLIPPQDVILPSRLYNTLAFQLSGLAGLILKARLIGLLFGGFVTEVNKDRTMI
jgi:hypothetical protein